MGSLGIVDQFRNVLGLQLEICSQAPLTGFFRNGYCATCPEDFGVHTVCAQMTDDFLNYTKQQGNDLSAPQAHFPGLKSGDRWCLCAERWKEAFQANLAPPLFLKATHYNTLDIISIENLVSKALDNH
ncbi:unnamed protein product [Didymodactylos carnosus]|uniref:DUF2237 domain-containing protein n=1 Tax=Didymodactylos carnosus TaxID=1234261 RepID=A0A814A5Q5_9BILA|nr:unnamed protein product [Didymodactylos carnosus]CAF3689194.1 unnamed protein product [Didymodactylos carnosus]